MKNFIEVLTNEQKTVLININLIFGVEASNGGCIIKMAANRYRDGHEQFYLYTVTTSYQEVCDLIEKAQQ